MIVLEKQQKHEAFHWRPIPNQTNQLDRPQPESNPFEEANSPISAKGLSVDPKDPLSRLEEVSIGDEIPNQDAGFPCSVCSKSFLALGDYFDHEVEHKLGESSKSSTTLTNAGYGHKLFCLLFFTEV